MPRKIKRKVVKLDAVTNKLIESQLAMFKEKFGRKPGPDDPVFFDPDSDTRQPYSEEKLKQVVIESALKADIDPVKALLQFGFDVSEEDVGWIYDSDDRDNC